MKGEFNVKAEQGVAARNGGRARPHAAADGKLKAEIVRKAKDFGANLVGVASVARWEEAGEVPADYRPQAIFAGTRSVVVVAVPMLLPIIESTPSINYQEMYNASNRLLDEISFRLASWLTANGHASLCMPRDGYSSLEALLKNPFGSFSHTYAGKYAGLGTVGLSRNLLVPDYGPRLRLNSVLTSAVLPADPLQPEELCNSCRLCERACPTGAIRSRNDGVIGDLDKTACTQHHITLRKEGHWPCGICAKVCPEGADRKLYKIKAGKRYLDEPAAIADNPDDPRFRHLVHLRRHGSTGDRLA
ncbi:MAG TPA: 4Fe-4S binding protein [Rhodopseudomonas sp.]|uniref:4Fe-4S binding protein n=1 Tax=Rhodopseudomonas sp. TaxID=1078 RepID=UPI002ED7DFA3